MYVHFFLQIYAVSASSETVEPFKSKWRSIAEHKFELNWHDEDDSIEN